MRQCLKLDNFGSKIPYVMIPQWDDLLDNYDQVTSFWPSVPLPTPQDYATALLSSKDFSSMGPDGLPYAAWRVNVPQSSEAMYDFMAKIQSGSTVPPVSVGCGFRKLS